jgi:hypothetical protein
LNDKKSEKENLDQLEDFEELKELQKKNMNYLFEKVGKEKCKDLSEKPKTKLMQILPKKKFHFPSFEEKYLI